MRRLIESGAVPGDRFLQIGLRGYWPEPPVLAWMAAQNMRSFEMTEIVTRGLPVVLDEAFAIAYLANRVMLEALSGYAWRRRKLAGQPVRDPNGPLLDGRS